MTNVTIALDSLEVARPLSEIAEAAKVRFGVLVEVDVGLARVGVTPSQALDLTRAVSVLPGLDWQGLTFYPGHIKDQNAEKLADLSRTIEGLVSEFRAAGIGLRLALPALQLVKAETG